MIGDEGVVLAFLAEGGKPAMAGQKHYVVAKRPELPGDRTDQGFAVAARQIGTPDGAPEQHVADNRQP